MEDVEGHGGMKKILYIYCTPLVPSALLAPSEQAQNDRRRQEGCTCGQCNTSFFWLQYPQAGLDLMPGSVEHRLHYSGTGRVVPPGRRLLTMRLWAKTGSRATRQHRQARRRKTTDVQADLSISLNSTYTFTTAVIPGGEAWHGKPQTLSNDYLTQ